MWQTSLLINIQLELFHFFFRVKAEDEYRGMIANSKTRKKTSKCNCLPNILPPYLKRANEKMSGVYLQHMHSVSTSEKFVLSLTRQESV